MEERRFWLRSIEIKEPAEVGVGSSLGDFGMVLVKLCGLLIIRDTPPWTPINE